MNKGALWNSIQEASNVGVEYPVHALPLNAHRQRVQRLVRAATGTEAIRESLEVHLVDLVEDGHYGLLYDLVFQRRVRGNMGSEAREFLVGVGESAQAKHQFQVGATVSGEALPVADPRLEIVEFYKVSNLKVAVRKVAEETPPPPWRGVAPPLSVYRERGHRRLAARTYEEKCTTCLWDAKWRWR